MTGQIKKDIIETKILDFLENNLFLTSINECEIVYLMAEIRKIIEKNILYETYSTLNFYCNWTLHTKLSRKSTQTFLLKKFKGIDFDKDSKEIASEMIRKESKFFRLEDLNAEFKIFFSNYGLPSNFIQVRWGRFIRTLLTVIEECPEIAFKDANIDRLILTKNNAGVYAYSFHLANRVDIPKVKLKL